MGEKAGARVAGLQRARLIAAVTEVVYERGAKEATVAEIVRRARISRRSFYEIFANSEECLLAALDEAQRQARRRVLASQGSVRGGWQAQMRAGVAALLGFFDESPQTAHLLVVESLVAGSEALQLREEVLCELMAAVERCAGGAGARDSAELVGEALVGAAFAILHRRLLHDAQRRGGRAATGGTGTRRVARRQRAGVGQGSGMGQPAPPVGRLVELQVPLMSMIVLFHVGASAARRERERPPTLPCPPNEVSAGASGVLDARDVRLTDRTILVLCAIGALSRTGAGPSNRQVARAAGVADQGQTSKLLSRLCRKGLIENSPGEVQLRANAWRLTPEGEAVVHSLPQDA